MNTQARFEPGDRIVDGDISICKGRRGIAILAIASARHDFRGLFLRLMNPLNLLFIELAVS
jgi:hypothetical protein